MSLDADQEDALRELINIGIGRAASTLSELMGTRIELTIPNVTLFGVDDLPGWAARAGGSPGMAIAQDFAGMCSGRAALVLPRNSGLRMAQILGGVEDGSDELDLELSGILVEVGNIMINGVLGSLANATGTRFTYGLPEFCGDPVTAFASALKNGGLERDMLVADAHFQVRRFEIQGSLLIALKPGGIEALLRALCASGRNTLEVR